MDRENESKQELWDLGVPETIIEKKQKQHIDEISIASWKAFFNDCFDQFEQQKLRQLSFRQMVEGKEYSFSHIHKEYYPRLLNAGEFPDDNIALLYRFHVQLETLMRLADYEKKFGIPEYPQSHFSLVLNQLVDGMFETSQQADPSQLRKNYLQLVEESLKEFQSVFQLPPKYSDRIFLVFQIGWATFYYDKEWVLAYEKQLLKEKEAGSKALFLDMALAHFSFLKGDLKETFERVDQMEEFSVYHSMVWIELLFSWRQWDDLLKWLLALKPTFKRILGYYYRDAEARELIHDYLHFFWKYAQYTGEEEEYEQLLIEFLPITFHEYGEYLLVQQHFERWVELYLLMGFSPSLINGADLKEVENENREVLLPLYHQSVDKLIREKNRKSYKLAVYFLKKLKTIYKKMKREERFEQFIEKLSDEYSRLRAFQEELKKGKLIS
ncbi:hypothetical protein [Fictibacillus gelatini]|uniref:hypothetical protein n=1 Tax=Fictibacillus gelatini TaxID=225985 RepID=UPI000408E9F4|nr:hypothetical protein [Fictibacillus gelatini]